MNQMIKYNFIFNLTYLSFFKSQYKPTDHCTICPHQQPFVPVQCIQYHRRRAIENRQTPKNVDNEPHCANTQSRAQVTTHHHHTRAGRNVCTFNTLKHYSHTVLCIWYYCSCCRYLLMLRITLNYIESSHFHNWFSVEFELRRASNSNLTSVDRRGSSLKDPSLVRACRYFMRPPSVHFDRRTSLQ